MKWDDLRENLQYLGKNDLRLVLWYVRWRKLRRAIISLTPASNRRSPGARYHTINDRRRSRSVHPMYPTPRMMAAVTFGMAAVSIVSWGLVLLGIPYALYLMPLYLVYV